MKEYVTDENQMKNLKKVKEDLAGKQMSPENIDAVFSHVKDVMNEALGKMKTAKISDVEVEKSEIYKSHAPLFLEISKKIVKPESSLVAYGLDAEAIMKMSKENEEGKPADEDALLKAMGLDGLTKEERNFETITEKFFGKLLERAGPETNEKLMREWAFSNEQTNIFINAIEDYDEVDRENKTNPNPILRRYVALNLYRDAYEIYLKVLKEIYAKLEPSKVEKARGRIYLRDMMPYFRDNYPLLLENVDSDLRDDISHLLYKARDRPLEEIDKERDLIMLKAYTGLIVRYDYIVNGQFKL